MNKLNDLFEYASPESILYWAAGTFGQGLVASSSFQTQSLPLLHLIARTAPQIPILFLDTGYHFKETLAFRDRIVRLWNLNLRVIRAARAAPRGLYQTDPDRCCHLNKVEPMKLALEGATAWISGIRRDQTATRGRTPILSRRPDGILKISPVAFWTHQDVEDYLEANRLPRHPLELVGYSSIGCEPCTRPAQDRSGRWAGFEKTECGLHLEREASC